MALISCRCFGAEGPALHHQKRR